MTKLKNPKKEDQKKRLIQTIALPIVIVVAAVGLYLSWQNFQNGEGFPNFSLDKDKSSLEFMPIDSIIVISGNDTEKGYFFDGLKTKTDFSISMQIDPDTNDMIVSSAMNTKDHDKNEIAEYLKNKMQSFGEVFTAEKDNFLLTANNKNGLEKIKQTNQEKNILKNRYWQEATEFFSNNDYMRIYVFAQNIFGDNSIIKYGVSEYSGEVLNGKIVGDKQKMKDLDITFNTTKDNEFYMFKTLPKKDLLFFIEGYDLKDKYELIQKILVKENPTLFSALNEQKKSLKESMDIDIENDIISWMNEGFVFTIHTSPNSYYLTFVFDVKSNGNKAKEFFRKLDGTMRTSLALMPEFGENIEYRDLGENLYSYGFGDMNMRFNLVPEELTLTYGVTDENLAIISTLPNAHKEITRNTEEIKIHEQFSEGQQLIYFKKKNKDNFLKTRAEQYEMFIEGMMQDHEM